jgi:hypothetical protein
LLGALSRQRDARISVLQSELGQSGEGQASGTEALRKISTR